MGSELLIDEAPPSYTQRFYEAFPIYLSYGMTYDQFWNDDVELVKYYREARNIVARRENNLAWLQGAYVYDALCAASPLFRAYGGGRVKANPYREEPYPMLDENERDNQQNNASPPPKVARFMNMVGKWNADFLNSHKEQRPTAKGGDANADD